MKSLTIDTRMLFLSGIGTCLKNLLPEIILSLSDCKIILLCDIEKIKGYEWAERENVKLINCSSDIYTLSEQLELLRKIPRDTDLFWSPHFNIPLFYKGLQVTTIHDIFHISEENADKTFFKNVYARTMLKAALSKSRIVFTDSQFTLSEMKKYNLSHLEKVKIIYYGSPLEGKRIQNKTEEQNGKHILFVGNVKPHKNIRRLVAAYKILREKYGVSLPLLIAGEYKNFRTGIPGFEEEINKSTLRKSIKFTGKISDDELYELYREASVLVLPSLYEGFGLPPLEAMSFGCPVVVSKAASLPEVCGEAALYIDPLNIEDIADKINQVLTDGLLRKALINKGFARLKKYSWKKAADEYIQQFRSII